MVSKDLFEIFCSNRNIKNSTIKSYRSAILKYESFHEIAMKDLIDEAIMDEESNIPLKNRLIKRRLMDFRAYLLDSGLSINTVRTYFSRIKTFYRHFEMGLPYLNDMKLDEGYLIPIMICPPERTLWMHVPFPAFPLRLLFFSCQAVDVLRLKRSLYL